MRGYIVGGLCFCGLVIAGFCFAVGTALAGSGFAIRTYCFAVLNDEIRKQKAAPKPMRTPVVRTTPAAHMAEEEE